MKIYKLEKIPKSMPKTLAMEALFEKEKILNEIVIGKTGNLNFCQSVKQKNYIEHCYNLFKPYTKKGIISSWNKRNGKLHEILNFYTCAIFKKYLLMFYKYEDISNKRIKIIPSNIEKLLTLRGLAYWLMDDGYYNKKKVFLCTHSFTQTEVILLASILENKFNIPTKVIQIKQPRKKSEFWYILRIENTSLLWNLVKDFILPSFEYKFGNSKDFPIYTENK